MILSRDDVKLGSIPSPHDALEHSDFAVLPMLAGVGTSFDPKPVDLFDFHRPRIQQANNCVAHARMNLIQVLMWIRYGTAGPLLSVAFPYGLAQLLWAMPARGEPFPDAGSSCALLQKAIRDHGVCSEALYPETLENCRNLAPDDVWQAASSARVDGCHRIAEGKDAPEQIAAALALAELGATTSSNFVMMVDDKFGALGPNDVYDSPGGNVWGAHDQAILAFDPDRGPRGSRGAFGVADTWGRIRTWVSWEYIAKYAREMFVTEVVPATEVL